MGTISLFSWDHLITLKASHETNGTNEPCLPGSNTQEEPLEAIDLDEIYKYTNEFQIDIKRIQIQIDTSGSIGQT